MQIVRKHQEICFFSLRWVLHFSQCDEAFHRVRLNLETLAGLRDILGCMQSNVPLHGHSSSEQAGGIAECRTLWLEFRKAKHGGKTTEEQPSNPQEDASDAIMEDATYTMIIEEAGASAEAEKPLDPLEQEARTEAQKHGSHIHRFNGKDGMKQLEQKLRLV